MVTLQPSTVSLVCSRLQGPGSQGFQCYHSCLCSEQLLILTLRYFAFGFLLDEIWISSDRRIVFISHKIIIVGHDLMQFWYFSDCWTPHLAAERHHCTKLIVLPMVARNVALCPGKSINHHSRECHRWVGYWSIVLRRNAGVHDSEPKVCSRLLQLFLNWAWSGTCECRVNCTDCKGAH